MVLPYDGRFIAVDDYYSDLFRQSLDISTLTTIQGNQTLMFGFISVGGIYVVDVAKYKECGWENENFLGWGPEDFEREHRLDILGHRPKRVSGVIYHLNHPRGVNSTNAIEDLAYSTKKEYCHVCSMLRPELISYIETWIWVH